MPFHLLPCSFSRRRFLASVLALSGVRSALATDSFRAGAETVTGQTPSVRGETWALLSDTHIAGDRELNARGINMADHLRQAVDEVLQSHKVTPCAGFLINGDCAYLDGQTEDYRVLGELLQPLTGAGIPIHLTLGNHDERTRIQEGLVPGWNPRRPGAPGRAEMEDKIASCVQGKFCDWYLLDSLEFTNRTSGRLGQAQLDWLESTLSSRPARPAVVLVHHNPESGTDGRRSGLRDTGALLELLTRNRAVKALFFGHTHVATVSEIEGLHLVNLPACAYRFDAGQPTGWTRLDVNSQGCNLQLFDTEQAHPLHGQEICLRWRS